MNDQTIVRKDGFTKTTHSKYIDILRIVSIFL